MKVKMNHQSIMTESNHQETTPIEPTGYFCEKLMALLNLFDCGFGGATRSDIGAFFEFVQHW
jgi:hypothetical protein